MIKTILAIDPGKVNMGYSIIQFDNGKYRIVARGMVENTIQDLKGDNIKPVVKKFHSEIQKKINTYGISELTMERFVSRGLLGSLSEFICIMQGILSINSKIKVFNLVTAATWKNAFNKHYELKAFYKLGKQYGILDHEVDAALIGLYYLGKAQHFTKFKYAKYRHRFFKRLKSL